MDVRYKSVGVYCGSMPTRVISFIGQHVLLFNEEPGDEEVACGVYDDRVRGCDYSGNDDICQITGTSCTPFGCYYALLAIVENKHGKEGKEYVRFRKELQKRYKSRVKRTVGGWWGL
mgnify:CR=1 FL=1|jgi:hypothetical protein